MTAVELLRNLTAHGIQLEPIGDKLKIFAPAGAITPELKAVLSEHKTDLIRLLNVPTNGEAENALVSVELCPVCCGVLFRRDGKRFDRLECPACHFSRLVDKRPEPLIKDGDLIIPFSADVKYQYWRGGGQKLCETLAELQASIDIWRRYCAPLTPNHTEICSGVLRLVGEVVFCRDCGRFAPAD